MTQQYHPPWTDGTSVFATMAGTEIPQTFETVTTLHSGAVAPTTTFPCMWWADTGTSLLKRRNSADTTWLVIGPLDKVAIQSKSYARETTITGALNLYCGVFRAAAEIVSITMIADGTTASSDGSNYLEFDLFNVGASAVSLFSALPNTNASVGGIGGGAEFAADTHYTLTPDQNTDIDAGETLELRLTVTGAPTISLPRFQIDVEYYPV